MRGRRILLLWFFAVLAAVSSPAFGSEPDPDPRDGEKPSVELLEFMGEWETGNGEWLDPTLLEDWTAAEETRKEEDDETH